MLDGFSFAVGRADGRRAAREHAAGHRGTRYAATATIATCASANAYRLGWLAGWTAVLAPAADARDVNLANEADAALRPVEMSNAERH